MKNLKVLKNLYYKVRRRTVLVSEQSFHDTFAFGEPSQSNLSVIFKQKVTTKKVGLHFLNLCGIKARTQTTGGWAKHDDSIKNNNLFEVKYLHRLGASTDCYDKHRIKFEFVSLNTVPPVPASSRKLQNWTQEKELNQAIARFDVSCKDRKVWLPVCARKFARPDNISTWWISSESGLCKRCLGGNQSLKDKVLTLRSSNRFFQKREKHKMIRPLLDFKRESITMVCKDFRMPVYPDQSNSSTQYSRNRIRKQIIPSIKYFINPQVESSLFKLAELLNKEQSFLYSVLRNMSTNVPLQRSL